MSYDIRFGVKVAGTEKDVYAVIGEPEYSSPTYNVGKIFRKCMDWDFRQGEWYKMTDIMPKIERGIQEITFNSRAYKGYEPDNGWGSTGTVMATLQSIKEWFDDEWKGWNGDIPLDCIYMSW